MDDKISIGDMVRLKSANQPMTVEDIQDDIAFCVWIHDGNKQKGEFSVNILSKLDPAAMYPKAIDKGPSTADVMRGRFLPKKP